MPRGGHRRLVTCLASVVCSYGAVCVTLPPVPRQNIVISGTQARKATVISGTHARKASWFIEHPTIPILMTGGTDTLAAI